MAALTMIRSADTGIIFFTGQMYCENTSTSAFWVNSSYPSQRYNVSDASLFAPGTACFAYNSSDYRYCCPTGQYCNFSSGTCYSTSGYQTCSEILNQATCLAVANNSAIGRISVINSSGCGDEIQYDVGSITCRNETRCGCIWDTTVLPYCKASKSFSWTCNQDPHFDDDDNDYNPGDYRTFGECHSWVSVVDNCGKPENNIIATTNTRWIGGNNPAPDKAECISVNQTKRTLSCVSVAQLDFTTNFGIALIIGLLIAGYLYIELRKK